MCDYRVLSASGICIYRSYKRFGVTKFAVGESSEAISEKLFETLESAENYAESLLKPEKPVWKAIIRYDRGLGVEYLAIEGIRCENESEAEQMAVDTSGLLSNPKARVIEVKIRGQF